VGSPDVQSMTRSISGGVDFVGGYERDIQFGIQGLLGVEVDIDRLQLDGVSNDLLFIDDSRSDLAMIEIPITWYHGRYDGWVELDRVRDVLSHGDTSKRRLIVVATGHQLSNSSQANEVFGWVASEIGRMALGRELSPQSAGTREVRNLRVAERHRLPSVETDLRNFWRDYLIGRDRSFGIELLTSGSAYRRMMELQVESLRLSSGDRVIDLGAGTGSFEQQLARLPDCPSPIHVTAVDYVREALRRARDRLDQPATSYGLIVSYLEADLNLFHPQQKIPLKSDSFEAAIASLLLNYLECPESVLREIRRLLRPGGRMVISSLRRDADFSRLYVENLTELQLGVARDELPDLKQVEIGPVSRSFLNDAARILELEEVGAFRFWDSDELEQLVAQAGFTAIKTDSALGTPPQALIVTATKS
jgi:ubiquinone/menaquinone biosynthesis C-methylase UbiE